MTLPIGTPLWKKPVAVTDGVATNTLCVPPASTTDACSEFVGVTVRDGENDAGEIRVQRTGDVLARVIGPFKVGDLACFSAGSTHLAVNNGKAAVGRTLQAITGGGVTLIAVRTGSPGAAASAAASHPFQVSKVSDSTVSVSVESFCLTGLNSREVIPIAGLGEVFTVLKNTVIYLEILFDINLIPILASVCAASGWGGEFPRSIKTVQKSLIETEKAAIPAAMALHVGILFPELAAQIAFALAKIELFKLQTATVKQWAAYVPIAFSTEAEVGGLAMLDGVDPFVIYQSLKTNLMLAQFCDSNVPCLYPIPSSSPIVERSTTVTFAPSGGAVAMSVAGDATAAIFYTLDGSTPSIASARYSTAVTTPTDGQTLKAIALSRGKFPSAPVTFV